MEAIGLNEEKLRALEAKGNVLVIANPGTGKTLLLAHKYVQLIRNGLKPEEILCLTYTNKAENEMRNAIIKALGENAIEIDLSRIKVSTFHSYALDTIGAEETISNNLLRYSIYRYLVDHRVLNYGDEYLISTIVPKIEDSIRYLKGFGVMPDTIDLAKVQRLLTEYKSISKEQMDKYAEAFIGIFRHYEAAKAGRGIDYADMLLDFMKLKKKPHFRYALVDELQDTSSIEADMVLESCDTFFVVGDKKQAIFAFQGGSIVNFEKFKNSAKPTLSQNFRSTNEILRYAREFYVGKTSDKTAAAEMRDLRNEEKKPGPKPKVYAVPDDANIPAVCELVQELTAQGKQVAVLARTNNRLREISQELIRRHIEHSSTYFQASDDAHTYVVRFLLGIFSNKAADLRNAMFTPFFPITLRDAFELAQLEKDAFRERLPVVCPEFKRLRDSVRKLPDVDMLFKERIIPVSVTYGREYLLAALNLQKTFSESIGAVGDINLDAVIAYLKASDLGTDESQKDRNVILTTVHKAKGRQFETVIYVPQKAGRENFQDELVKKILATQGRNVEEEVGEEPLRIDFVALTRAKDELHIVTEDVQNYLNKSAEPGEAKASGVEWTDTSDKTKRAFNLFVNGEPEKAKDLLEAKKAWLRDFVRDWFAQLDHVSFTSLPEGKAERAAQDYLLSKVLNVEIPTVGLAIGSKVHDIAEAMLLGNKYEVPEGLEPFVTNVQRLIDQIKKEYPDVELVEHKILLPLEKLVGDGEGMNFEGVIDAAFKNAKGDFLLVDWKTDRDFGRSSTHRQQLQAYRHAFSIMTGVPLDRIRTAIGFVGIRGTVNIGRTDMLLDSSQPRDSAFETFKGRVAKVLQWKRSPDSFLEELGSESDDMICRAVQEEFELEK